MGQFFTQFLAKNLQILHPSEELKKSPLFHDQVIIDTDSDNCPVATGLASEYD